LLSGCGLSGGGGQEKFWGGGGAERGKEEPQDVSYYEIGGRHRKGRGRLTRVGGKRERGQIRGGSTTTPTNHPPKAKKNVPQSGQAVFASVRKGGRRAGEEKRSRKLGLRGRGKTSVARLRSAAGGRGREKGDFGTKWEKPWGSQVKVGAE